MRERVYLLDEPTITLTIHSDGQATTAHASGQVSLDLRALPRRATLHDAPPDCPEIIAFSVVADDRMNGPNARRGDG